MKAFIVTVLAPEDWQKTDVLCSVNIGIKKFALTEQRDIGPMDYNAMVIEELSLRELKNGR